MVVLIKLFKIDISRLSLVATQVNWKLLQFRYLLKRKLSLEYGF